MIFLVLFAFLVAYVGTMMLRQRKRAATATARGKGSPAPGAAPADHDGTELAVGIAGWTALDEIQLVRLLTEARP